MAQGKMTAHDQMERSIAAVDGSNSQLNAFLHLHRTQALQAASQADLEIKAGRSRGPLHGVAVAVKDNIDEQGTRCGGGCFAYQDRLPARDAKVISQLRHAGAVVLGRTNMSELADGVNSENPHYGPVHNPWRLGCHPGGSSGGSAAALACGSVRLALGTDTGGSIRIPASLCGIVGFKPTAGLISTDGVMPLSTSLDHVGPMAQQVADLAQLFEAIAPRAKHEDPGCAPRSAPIRLGVLEGFGMEADRAVAQCFESALRLLASLGNSLAPVRVVGLSRGIGLLSAIYLPEFARAHGARLAERPEQFGDFVRKDLERGLRQDPARREQALQEAQTLKDQLGQAMADVDLLVSPTTPHPAKDIGSPNPHTYLQFTCPFNLTGQPAISVPMGLVDGLPVGLQLIGRTGEDWTVLMAAAAFERALGFSLSPAVRV